MPQKLWVRRTYREAVEELSPDAMVSAAEPWVRVQKASSSEGAAERDNGRGPLLAGACAAPSERIAIDTKFPGFRCASPWAVLWRRFAAERIVAIFADFHLTRSQSGDIKGKPLTSLLEQKRTKVTKKWGWEYSAGDAEKSNPALLPSVQIFF